MLGGVECVGDCGKCDMSNLCVVVYLCWISGVILDVVMQLFEWLGKVLGLSVQYCEFDGFGYGLMLLVLFYVVLYELYGVFDCSVGDGVFSGGDNVGE